MRLVARVTLAGLVILVVVLLPDIVRLHLRAYAMGSLSLFFALRAPVEHSLTLSNGAILRLSGAEEPRPSGQSKRVYMWHGRYQATPGVGADEFVGVWEALRDAPPRVYVVNDLVVLIADEDHWKGQIGRIFVRTRRGHWKQSRMQFHDIVDGFDPPELTSLLTSIAPDDVRAIRAVLGARRGYVMDDVKMLDFSVERAELRVQFRDGPDSRYLRLTLSPDGERWQLTGIEAPR